MLGTDFDLSIFAISEEHTTAGHTRRGAARDETEAGRIQVGPAFRRLVVTHTSRAYVSYIDGSRTLDSKGSVRAVVTNRGALRFCPSRRDGTGDRSPSNDPG